MIFMYILIIKYIIYFGHTKYYSYITNFIKMPESDYTLIRTLDTEIGSGGQGVVHKI